MRKPTNRSSCRRPRHRLRVTSSGDCLLGLDRFVGINQFLELLGDLRRLSARLLVKPGQTHSRDDVVPHVFLTSLLIHVLEFLLVHELKSVLILEDRSILHADFPALIPLLTLYGDKGHAFAAGLTRDDLALKGRGIEQVRLGILTEGLGRGTFVELQQIFGMQLGGFIAERSPSSLGTSLTIRLFLRKSLTAM